MAAFSAERDAPPGARRFTEEDFSIRVEDRREDFLPEDQPPAPRNAASIPTVQPSDADEEVGLDLKRSADEFDGGKRIRQRGGEGKGRALQAVLKSKFKARVETATDQIAVNFLLKPKNNQVLAARGQRPGGRALQAGSPALDIAAAIYEFAQQQSNICIPSDIKGAVFYEGLVVWGAHPGKNLPRS